ncbi:hypothetical protein [Hymenobacter actinosclerus]|uniref:Uncharacterized protein n=1 Tax=Hymenobacter actinosclerus TaxID=82805 RepID=A0A1I0GP12_9BACT|nr:hypothetical protein [Hymenobacter actinosclerus]SET72781.1 hypothetical protein SAMN04487998_2508 [Hymenobacter actinosclerus]
MADWQSTINLLLRIGESASLLLLGVIWGRKTNLGSAFRPLLGYLASDALIYVIDFFGRKILHNNIFIFQLSTFCDVTWLTLIFINLASNKTNKWLITGWLIFFFSTVVSIVWVDGITTNMNTLSRAVGNTFLVFMAFRQLSQMIRHEYLFPPFKSPPFVFCTIVAIYYSSSLPIFLGQDLPRYGWLISSDIVLNTKYFIRTISWFYPFLRAIQFGLLLHLITLFPMGVTPRHALPRWLRFRLGWRPPTKNWRYRVLPPHLVG